MPEHFNASLVPPGRGPNPAAPRIVVAQPLTSEAFAPFGEVIVIGNAPGRTYYEQALGHLRQNTRPSISIMVAQPVPSSQSLVIKTLERHEFSSQTFVPVSNTRWLVVVSPHLHPTLGPGPDVDKAVAFIANGQQGITYRPDTWHHGLTVLEGDGQFAVFMWRDGSTLDEEFYEIAPFEVRLPQMAAV